MHSRAHRKKKVVAVTSEADTATRKAFPIGRWVNSVWEHYSTGQVDGKIDHTPEQQREANVKTIGHAERYRTHRLEYHPSEKIRRITEQKQSDAGACGCPYRGGINNLLAHANIRAELKEWGADYCTNMQDGHRKPNWTRTYAGDGAILRHDPSVPDNGPDNPFWVIYADKNIIADHNEFYTPLFLNFVRHTYDDSLHLWGLQQRSIDCKSQ